MDGICVVKKLVGCEGISEEMEPAHDSLSSEGSEVDGAMCVCSGCLHLFAGLGN